MVKPISELLDSQGQLTCPVCNETFDPNDDTKYIISGGYACHWKCFLAESKRRDKEKALQKEALQKEKGAKS